MSTDQNLSSRVNTLLQNVINQRVYGKGGASSYGYNPMVSSHGSGYGGDMYDQFPGNSYGGVSVRTRLGVPVTGT